MPNQDKHSETMLTDNIWTPKPAPTCNGMWLMRFRFLAKEDKHPYPWNRWYVEHVLQYEKCAKTEGYVEYEYYGPLPIPPEYPEKSS